MGSRQDPLLMFIGDDGCLGLVVFEWISYAVLSILTQKLLDLPA